MPTIKIEDITVIPKGPKAGSFNLGSNDFGKFSVMTNLSFLEGAFDI